MALQVWLPLNGNIKNQGLSSLQPIQTTTPTYVDGKLGKAMSTGAFYLPATEVAKFYNNNAMSWTFWIYPTTSGSVATPIIGQNNTGAGDCRMFTIFQYPNGVDLHLSWQTEAGGNAFLASILSDAFTVNTWNHCAITYDGSTIRIYINGDIKATYTNRTSNRTNFNYNVPIPNSSSRYLSDVRIYDHVLSPKEVELLSRGLVVHYPMNNGGRGGANLAKGSNTNSTSTNTFGFSEATGGSTRTIELVDGIYCAKITRNTTTHGSWSYLWYSNWDRSALKTNTTYTLSFDVIGSGSGTIGFLGFMNGNATNNISASVSAIQNSFNANNWSHLVFRTTTISDFTDKGTGQTIYMSCPFLTGTETWIMMKNMHLEEGAKDTPWIPHTSDTAYTTMEYNNIEYDVSGNNNHSTITGTLEYSSNSAKYSSCVGYNNSSYSSVTLNTSDFANIYTFSWWARNTSQGMFWGFANGNRLNLYMANNVYYWNTGDGGNNPFNVSSTPYRDGNWHHYAITGDGTTVKLYIDATQQGVAKTFKGITGTILIFNGWDTSSSYDFNGYLSDFRLYATALTADQIKELYQTSASIDKNGNMYAYEYVEV